LGIYVAFPEVVLPFEEKHALTAEC
jgi:hypothetical protein